MSASPDPLPRLIAEGRFAEVETLCRTRLQTDPADAAALGALLPQLMGRGELLQARVYAEYAVQADGKRRELLLMLGQVRQRMRDFAAARDAFAQAAALHSGEWIAPLFLADCAEAEGDAETALAARVQALLRAEREGALAPDAQVPAPLRVPLDRTIERVQRARAERIDAALAPAIERHGKDALARVSTAFDALLNRGPRAEPHPLQHPTLLCMHGLTPLPWYDRAAFPEIYRALADIEAQTDAIREELLALLEDEAGVEPYIDMPERAPAAPVWRELNRSPRWRTYHFHRHGTPVAAHHARCPRTAAALAALPLIRIPEHAPEAMFSLLAPNTAIPAHTGVMNGRLTAHLPLIVPPDCGALKVGGEARCWEEGRCIVFDDSFVHEAWNRSDRLRAVLIFDLWHPELRAIEREALTAAIVALGEFNRHYGAEDSTRET